MKVGLIHAMKNSVEPIDRAFRELAPEVDIIHLMDTDLLPQLQKHQSMTPAIISRFSTLIKLAVDSDVDCIQLTCSAFNDLTEILQPLSEPKLFRSDEAMLDQALKFNRIGLISTVRETPPVLLNYIKAKKPDAYVKTMVNTEALTNLLQGNVKAHDEMIIKLIEDMESEVDVIVLTQYSMAHVSKLVSDCHIPILSGPDESVKRCLHYISEIRS